MWDLICQDSLLWLKRQKNHSINNILSGIPDMDELDINDIQLYKNWIEMTVDLLFQKTSEVGYIILIQTDRKVGGQWIDKSTIINNIAQKNQSRLLWHKIVLNRPVGSANLHRPTYSHMLCYSRFSKPGNGLPDVIESGGRLYKNGTPINAVKMSIDYLLSKRSEWNRNNDNYDIVDPFVGQGTVVYYAIKNGLSALGIDIDPEQIKISYDLINKPL